MVPAAACRTCCMLEACCVGACGRLQGVLLSEHPPAGLGLPCLHTRARGACWERYACGRCVQESELKSAFKRLAVLYHPDKALSGCAPVCSLSGHVTTTRDDGMQARLRNAANDVFQLINEAWETLKDPSKRRQCLFDLSRGSAYGAASSAACISALLQFTFALLFA